MKPLAVELLPRRPRRPIGLLLLTALGCIVAVYEFMQVRQQQARLAALIEQIYTLSAAAQAASSAAAAAAPPPPYYEDALRIADMAAFDWGGVLKAVESLRLPGLRVTALSIDAGSRVVRLELSLADLGQVSEVLSLLGSGDTPSRWRLVQAQADPAGGKASATLEGRW